MGVTNHLLTGMLLPEWHDEVYISTGGLSSQGFHTWKTPIVCLLNDGMVVLHPVFLSGGLEVPLANEHRSVYNIYMEPVNMLYFGTSTLQRKAQTPIKMRVIWVPGIYIYKNTHMIICIYITSVVFLCTHDTTDRPTPESSTWYCKFSATYSVLPQCHAKSCRCLSISSISTGKS